MPFIEMSLQRKVLLVAIGALLSAIPFVYLVFFLRGELLESIRNVGGVYVVTSVKVNVLWTISLVLAMLPYAVVDYFIDLFIDRVHRELPGDSHR